VPSVAEIEHLKTLIENLQASQARSEGEIKEILRRFPDLDVDSLQEKMDALTTEITDLREQYDELWESFREEYESKIE
jgi:predicted nuclease with TOPRIM domain